jgi:hypothetical protein
MLQSQRWNMANMTLKMCLFLVRIERFDFLAFSNLLSVERSSLVGKYERSFRSICFTCSDDKVALHFRVPRTMPVSDLFDDQILVVFSFFGWFDCSVVSLRWPMPSNEVTRAEEQSNTDEAPPR